MIIVTGATGFIGRYLVDHLVRSGEQVIATGRTPKYDEFFRLRGVTRVPLDVSDPDSFKQLPSGQHHVTEFIHLAAAIPAATQDLTSDVFLKTNTLGTFYALEYCRRNNIKKFLYTTTRFECGAFKEFPIKESMGRKYMLTGDHASYVIAEVAASQYVEHYAEEYGMQGIIFRLTGILGYGRFESAFEVFYKTAKAGKPIEVWGAHKARRDNLYVKDAVRAFTAALAGNSARGVYSIASGEGRTNEDDAKAFAEVFGSKLVYRPEIPEKDETYYFDISKAKQDFGWHPTYKFHDVLRDYDREAQSGRFRS